MRIPVALTLVTVLLGACIVEVGYEGTAYQCNDGVCPVGFECVEARCVPSGERGDGSPGTDAPVAQGLQGTYFHDLDLTSEAFVRTDPMVDFSWDHDSPAPSMDADTFSVRWVGYVVPRYSELYTFSTLSDDGVRLWVAGELLVDDWSAHNERLASGNILLEAGQAYAIQLDYFDDLRTATIRLRWSSASQADEIVPEERLRPPGE